MKKFPKGTLVAYTTSHNQKISGVVFESSGYIISGNNLELVQVIFQNDTNARGIYAAYDESGEGQYYTSFISGDNTAPAHIEVINE